MSNSIPSHPLSWSEIIEAHDEGTVLYCGTGRGRGLVVLEHPDPSLRGDTPVVAMPDGDGLGPTVWVRLVGEGSCGYIIVRSQRLRRPSAEELLGIESPHDQR